MSEPIACNLSSPDLSDRVAAWRSLGAQALRRTAEPGRVVSTYPKHPELAGALTELIEAERECCPFLEFEVREQESEIEVELRYPPEFGAMVATVLDAR